MTPIRQVELSAPLTAIQLPDSVRRCMLVFRWRNRVVGRGVVPVRRGEITTRELQDAVGRLAPGAADAAVEDTIGYDPRAVLGARVPSASVVICTRERPDDLARALEALSQLHPAPLEVLVVDNAPATDATRDTVARAGFARYVREDRRGLNAARNRALREARGDVVAFTDDDAVPESQWLAGLLANFADPTVVIATGLTLPLELETEGQELFEEHCTFVRGFTRRVFDGQHHNPFAVGPVGAGANMAVRKNAVLQLGGFDERLDGGMPTRSGGDHDVFVRTLLAGHRIVYDPAAVSWHRHRRTTAELLDTVYGYGVGVYAMWTGLLVERREIGVLRLAWQWFTQGQLRNLLQRRDAWLRRIAWQELKGCVRGPFAWFEARTRQGEPV
jgi:glycosyltransferase involved in cell wall biosynthesis